MGCYEHQCPYPERDCPSRTLGNGCVSLYVTGKCDYERYYVKVKQEKLIVKGVTK